MDWRIARCAAASADWAPAGATIPNAHTVAAAPSARPIAKIISNLPQKLPDRQVRGG
jgi:hypothetical protein